MRTRGEDVRRDINKINGTIKFLHRKNRYISPEL